MFASIATAVALSILSPAQSGSAPPVVVTEEITFEERLERLVERMEKERVTNHIPGFALAVVKDDEVVLAHGFGLADVEKGRPVTPETTFAIGSTTKAFTATLIAMLQDDGKLEIDDPVVKFIPSFKLHIDVADGEDDVVTLRDLLCHRTGFTRMNLLWASGTASREAILDAATRAEPWAGFREKFLYSNVMFLAAGMASGAAAGSDWDTLVRERILTPLGMSSTTLSTAEAQKDARLALGYLWNEEEETFTHRPMLEIKGIGPAGSINSNVIDMAKWVRFQLGRGEFEGKRLVSAEALEECWKPNVEISGDVKYGLGWMLREHAGHRVVEHGGNIDGFAAEVALLPDDGLGFVLLTNTSMTILQQSSIPIVIDTLLGAPERDEGDDGADFADYVGSYRANFAHFRDEEFRVLVQNDNLAVDVPGQMIFELHLPDEEGKRYFQLTDTIAVSFDRDATGKVVEMTMYQSGMTFEMPRDGVEVPAEIPLDELQRFLGRYKDVERDVQVEVVIQNNRLAVDIPDQMVFELHVPDAEGKRLFRVTSDVAVRFNEGEEGDVESLTLIERGTPHDAVKIREDDVAELDWQYDLPSRDEFLAGRHPFGLGQLLAEHGTTRETGTMRVAQSGLDGNYVFEAQLDPPAFRMTMDFGDFGKVAFGSDGTNAWSFSTLAGYVELSGKPREQMNRSHPSIVQGDWGKTYDNVFIRKATELDGKRVLLVELVQGDLPPFIVYVESATGRVLRMDHVHVEGALKVPTQTTFDDFRDVEGVAMPHTTSEQNEMAGRSTLKTDTIEVGVKLPADFPLYKE